MIDLNHITIDLSNLPPTTGPRPSRQMVASVKQYGVLIPIIVRLGDNGYEVIDGMRRVGAMRANGHVTAHMPAIVIKTADPELITLIVNELRDPNYATETAAIGTLIDKGYDSKAITAQTGMPGVSIDKRRRYAEAHPVLQEAFNAGQVSASTMDAAARCDADVQSILATVFSGKGRISTADIKRAQETLRAPLPTEDTYPGIYPPATEITVGDLIRSLYDICDRAKASGFSFSQVSDIVNTAPAFAPQLSEVVF